MKILASLYVGIGNERYNDSCMSLMHSHDVSYKLPRNSWYDITHSGRVARFIAATGAHTSTQAATDKKKSPTSLQEERPVRTEGLSGSRKEA